MITSELTISESAQSVAQEFDAIIESVTHCVDRGKDRGKCHVFLDYSNKCQCGDTDLERERMK